MRESGRVSIVGLLATIGAVIVFSLLLFSKESPSSVGGRFMDALARGDSAKLTELTYLSGKSKDEIKKEWEFSTQTAGKYYTFLWTVVAATQADDKTASVRLQVQRNVMSGSSYDENFQLPLVKVDDKWLVDVAAISREMYPGLPRAGLSASKN